MTNKQIRLIYVEVVIKNVSLLILFSGIFVPGISYEFEVLQKSQQQAVLSILGFLMAAGIIGAFELSYIKTNLAIRTHRYLAHVCKFFIYLAVCTLIWIGHNTMAVFNAYFNDWIFGAGIMIVMALFVYDFWDIASAVNQQFQLEKGNH